MCVICKQPTGALPKATLTEKGSVNINKAGKERKDTVFCSPGQKIHQEYHHKYCKPDQTAKALRLKEQQVMPMNIEKQVFRSAELILALTVFTVVNQQYLEGREKVHSLLLSGQLKQRIQYWQYVMKDLEGMIGQSCASKSFTCLPSTVVHAADEVYHRECSVNFCIMKQVPVIHDHEGNTSKMLKIGRPPEKQRVDVFLEVARFLEENYNEQITIHALIQCMHGRKFE